MSTPSITPAQIVAAAGAIVGLLVADGLVTNHTGKLITGLAAILVPFAILLADAIIRHGRSRALVAQPTATTGKPSTPPPGTVG